MLGEVARTHGQAASRKIIGASEDREPKRRDAACDQRGVGQRTHAHREVVAIGEDIHLPVAERHVDAQPGMRVHEGGEHRREMGVSESDRRGDPQQTG